MANRVRPLREALGLSVEQLAVRAGISYGALYAIEHNPERLPSFAVAQKLAAALGVSLEDLAEPITPAVVAELPAPTPEQVARLRAVLAGAS